MSFEPLDFLRHIKVEVDYLQVSCAGLTLEEFLPIMDGAGGWYPAWTI